MEFTEIMTEIRERIFEISGIEPEEIPDDASLINDIGLSSLETMTLLDALEERYSKRLSVRDLRVIVTVRDLALFFAAEGGEGAS